MDALLVSPYLGPEMHIPSRGSLRVTYPRQEPYAVVPHVRICARGGR